MSDENVGGLPPLSEEIQGFLNVHPFGYSHALGLLKRYARDAISAHGQPVASVNWAEYWSERGRAHLAHDFDTFHIAEQWRNAHGQPPPRVTQEMADSLHETAQLLDEVDRRSEARREKYGMHGQPVVDENAINRVMDAQPFASENDARRVWQLFKDDVHVADAIRGIVAALTGANP